MTTAHSTEVRLPGYWVVIIDGEVEVWLVNDTDTPSYEGPTNGIHELFPELWCELLRLGHLSPLR